MNLTYSTTTTINGEDRDIDVLIDITNIVVVPPDHSTWDSDVDYHGYRELTFTVESVTLFDEDGNVVQVILDKGEIEGFNLDYGKIEAWAWEALEEMKGDDYDY